MQESQKRLKPKHHSTYLWIQVAVKNHTLPNVRNTLWKNPYRDGPSTQAGGLGFRVWGSRLRVLRFRVEVLRV